MTTTDKNEMIAKFMAAKKDGKHYLLTYLKSEHKTGWYEPERMRFHNSWDWLMPVVEKISALKFGENDTHYPRTFAMKSEEIDDYMVRFNGYGLHTGRNLFDAVYSAVVDFVAHNVSFVTGEVEEKINT